MHSRSSSVSTAIPTGACSVLNLFAQRDWNCQTGGRRNFLVQVGSLAGLGLSLEFAMRSRLEAAVSDRNLNCILIWTRGGTSHIDSIDPKPEASADIRGEFSTISTALPGVQFTDLMPRCAERLSQFALLRNLNPKNGSHSVADAIMMSGKTMNPTITYPCFGSVIARERGMRNSIPPFIQIGSEVDRRARGGLAGYLGIEHNPFEVPGDPNSENFSVRDVTPPGGLTLDRFERRRRALDLLDTLPRKADENAGVIEATDQFYQNAFEVISSPQTKQAFDLSQESDETRDAYGRHYFGQSCLLGRRLIEAGARFVTVSSGGWDTHSSNFSSLKKLLPPVDQGIPALIDDLDQRGLLDTTLVVWMTDFGSHARDQCQRGSRSFVDGQLHRHGRHWHSGRAGHRRNGREGVPRCGGRVLRSRRGRHDLLQTRHPARHVSHRPGWTTHLVV